MGRWGGGSSTQRPAVRTSDSTARAGDAGSRWPVTEAAGWGGWGSSRHRRGVACVVTAAPPALLHRVSAPAHLQPAPPSRQPTMSPAPSTPPCTRPWVGMLSRALCASPGCGNVHFHAKILRTSLCGGRGAVGGQYPHKCAHVRAPKPPRRGANACRPLCFVVPARARLRRCDVTHLPPPPQPSVEAFRGSQCGTQGVEKRTHRGGPSDLAATPLRMPHRRLP